MKHKYLLTFRERVEIFPGMRCWQQQSHEMEIDDEQLRELDIQQLAYSLKDKAATVIGQVGLARIE